MFEVNEPYSWDLPLFKQLGLQPFKTGVWKETFVGEVIEDVEDDKNREPYRIKVWVNCAPAQFWQFEIYQPESKRIYRITTGSGSFRDYWPIAERLAAGMVNVFLVSGPNEAEMKEIIHKENQEYFAERERKGTNAPTPSPSEEAHQKD